MKKMLHSLCFLAVIFSNSVFAADKKIELIEFKDAAIEDATRILAAMTGSNIAVTQAASGVQVNLLLRDVYLKHAVDTLSRVSGLWYRYSKSNDSYLIMTEEQYQGDIVVYRDDIVRTFTLRHQNTESAAQTIKNLYGDRVELTLEDDNNGFDGLNANWSANGGGSLCASSPLLRQSANYDDIVAAVSFQSLLGTVTQTR
mgnify:CR=1 FL=1